MKRTLKIVGAAFGILLVVLLALLLYYFSATAGTRLDPEKLHIPNAGIRLYDAREQEIPAVYTANTRTQSLPEYVGQAFVAVEDKRFYCHHGIDTTRMFGALWSNLKSFSFREGASTISQQLIDQIICGSEKRYELYRELRASSIALSAYSQSLPTMKKSKAFHTSKSIDPSSSVTSSNWSL